MPNRHRITRTSALHSPELSRVGFLLMLVYYLCAELAAAL